MSRTPPIVLTFAGSDPTGGAGLQADLLTAAGMGCHPLSVVTALTVQDTHGVAALHPVDAARVRMQAERLLADVRVGAFKVGVLGSAANVEVVAAIGTKSLIDVRSPDEYAGRLLAPAHLPQEQAQRGGHIPTAVNVPWSKAANDDGTFRSDDELKELYSNAGLNWDKDIIAYCRIGERSAHTWFVLHQILGQQNVKNYDGSWTEYGSLVGVPVAVGDEPGTA